MLVPPAGEAPIRHRPLETLTIASAMARPSPAPPGVSVARWKRSKMRVRSPGGIPGPESSTVTRTRAPSCVTETWTVPPSGEYRQALSSSTLGCRSSHSGGIAITLHPGAG